MVVALWILPLLFLAAPGPASKRALACRFDALTEAQRAGHRALGEKLLGAVVRTSDLSNGYEIAFDLRRITDREGKPYCVVELAQWVELEAKCCPFLDFRIDVVSEGGEVRMRLTGPAGVREFLRTEIPLLAATR